MKLIFYNTVIVLAVVLGTFLFFRDGEDKNLPDVVIINNQGGDMEGHTPRGFQGMGTGLFAGDNLNSGFPNNDGVQFFLTFDLSSVPSDRIASAELRSKNLRTQGSPLEDLGALKAEVVRYDTFSSALWNLQPDGTACTLTISSDGSVLCTVTDVIQKALQNGSRSAQFRIRFEKTGDGDGNPDLALFYNTDSNKNEVGIFQLEIALMNASADASNDIHIPVVLHIIKNSGRTSTVRNKDSVLALFQKSQGIWNQAHITFDTTLKETVLDDNTQKAVERQDFEKLYAAIPINDGALHVVFLQTLSGPNGITITPSLALIADRTTVNDFRATAHEIGHLLGLPHTNESQERLLFQGVNGTQLIPEEINLARQRAKIL